MSAKVPLGKVLVDRKPGTSKSLLSRLQWKSFTLTLLGFPLAFSFAGLLVSAMLIAQIIILTSSSLDKMSSGSANTVSLLSWLIYQPLGWKGLMLW